MAIALKLTCLVAGVAISGCGDHKDCGPSACGPCKQPGCAAAEKCVDGQWQCLCVCPDGGQRPMPDYLKGTATCGTTTCPEGSVCISACLSWCSNAPDGGSCPSGCNFYPGHGCYSCSSGCYAVPSRCFTPCPTPGDPSCQAAVSGCSSANYCDGQRQMSCAPY